MKQNKKFDAFAKGLKKEIEKNFEHSTQEITNFVRSKMRKTWDRQDSNYKKMTEEHREMKKWLNKIYEDGFMELDDKNEFFRFVEKLNGNPLHNLVLFQEDDS